MLPEPRDDPNRIFMKNPRLILSLLALPAGFRAHAHPGHDFADPVLLAAAGLEGEGTRAPAIRFSEASFTIEGDYRIIHANGLPDHATGRFPNSGNPNRIAPQNYSFRVPLDPKAAERPVPLGMHPFGIAVNGVVLDPAAAEWWRNERGSHWQYEAMAGGRNLGLDQNNAHVQSTGAYHYHGVPTRLIEKLAGGKPRVLLLGWAADGFPIYGPWGYTDAGNTNSPLKRLKSSYRVKAGERPGGPGGKYDGTFVADYDYVNAAGDLDECNGRFGVTTEFPKGTYHYVLTDDFPFIPRLFKGTPDSSFLRSALGPGGRPRPPAGRSR
jgi:hypothetical protein